jgi:glycosyltransferase involved in cell wall biosynthesis
MYQKLAARIGADVEFYPSGRIRAYFRRPRTLTTCHNLLLFDEREMARFEGQQLRDFKRYRAWQVRSLLRATATVFLSRRSKEVVCGDLPELRNTAVIPHGLDPEFLLEAPRRYTLGKEVRVLCVSSIQHYKNFPQLVAATAEVRTRLKRNLQLRIVGGADRVALNALHRAVATCKASGFVSLVGEASRSELVKEYRQADVFAFASSSETFGISLLEAMGMRLPIACSSRTGLPDLLGKGGVYFDPSDTESIAEAIIKLVSREALRRKVATEAYRRARQFTWARAAEQTFAFVREVATLDG